MADKAEAKAEGAAAASPEPAETKKPGLMSRTPVLVGTVMVLEAAVLFAGFKLLGGGPHPAGAALALDESGALIDAAAGAELNRTVEISVLSFRAPNKISGRTFIYDVDIYVSTRAEFEQKVKQTIEDRSALIKDRIRTIIAQSDPERLGGGSEPGLETLRRQVKYQLDEIVGEGLIEEVLVPRCIPFRAEF